MPELLPLRVPPQLRRMVLSVACTLPLLCGFSGAALAQNVSAGLRACTREADPGRRLACYDREMGRRSPPAVTSAPAVSSAPQAQAVRPASGPTPANPDLPPREAAPPPGTAAPTSPSGQTASRESPAPRRAPVWRIFAGGGASSRLTAHVARLERSPDAMILHLDNGQVWRQIGRASGDLSLHEGDSVTIEEHLGSYWLSSRYVSNMQVRQEPQPAR
jgi:hypothetical protein